MSTTRDDLDEHNIQLSIADDTPAGYNRGGLQALLSGCNITSENYDASGTLKTDAPEKTPVHLHEKVNAFLSPWWNTIFVISSVLAVSLDPLFFYIPIIDRTKLCLGAHENLKTAALIFRTVTDSILVVHVIYQIREAIKVMDPESKFQQLQRKELRKPVSGLHPKISEFYSNILDIFECVDAVVEKLSWRSIVTDVLALLPIPQVLLVVVFYQMKGSKYLDYRKILSAFLLSQYVVRVVRIYLSSKKLTKSYGIWLKGLFNFFLYILASHVLGAFWYFFSIQRETSCWRRNCSPNCTTSNFYCHGWENSTDMMILMTSLNKSCAVEVAYNETANFDFGIFLDSLKSGNTLSEHFPEKLAYCFWWGLRNLSNFGTNLTTSKYIWESCFAILISIIGLLLFLYLIGNVQTFMSMQVEKSEEIREKMKRKAEDLNVWMDRNNVPRKLRKQIKRNIEQKLEEDRDADLENLFSILPFETQIRLKRILCLNALRRVPRLEGKDEKVLKMICDHLRPVKYPQHSFVAKINEPLDHMIFITKGTMWIYSTSAADPADQPPAANASPSPSPLIMHKSVERGGFYGDDQLLGWVSPTMLASNYKTLPISTENVKCHTPVEGFALTAKDLQSVVSKCKFLWSKNNAFEEDASGGTTTTGRANRRRHRGATTAPN